MSRKPSQTHALWVLMVQIAAQPENRFLVGVVAGLVLALAIIVKLG